MKKEDREKYIRQVCKDRGFSAEKTDKIVAKAHADAEADADHDDFLEALYALPVKGSADYNRQLDELKAKARRLDEWHVGANATVQQKTKLAEDLASELAKFKAKYGELDDAGGDDKGKGGDNKTDMNEIKKEIDARDSYYLALMADQNAILASHAKMFKGEIIDTTPLLQYVAAAQSDPIKPRQLSLREAYNEMYAERIEQHNIEVKAADEKRLKEEGAKEERARMIRSGYKPTGATVSEPSSNLFHAIKTDGKKDDPDRNRSEEEENDLFTAEFAAELQKVGAEADT